MLPSFKTILYSTDLSENTRPAFRHAVSLARRFQAKVHILHIIPDFDAVHQGYIVASYGPLTSTVRDESKTAEKRRKGKEAAVGQLRQRLQEFAAEELGGEAEAAAILGDIEVVVGSPVAEILKAADRLNADMLVFGSHSKGFIQHTFLGSVAEKVLRKTRRPTLIVPPPFN